MVSIGQRMESSSGWIVGIVVFRTPVASAPALRGFRMGRRTTWMILLAGVCAPFPAAAEILDRIEIVPTRSAAEIHIFFTTPVVYQSHFPRERSDFVRVDLVLPQLDAAEDLRRERLTSPPSKLVPSFIVSFPALSTATTRSLAIKFRRPVELTVRKARSRTSIVLAVPLKEPQVRPQALPPTPEARAPAQAVKPRLKAQKERKSKRPGPPKTARSPSGPGVQVIGPIKVVRKNQSADIHIEFKMPLSYLYHSPKAPSDFIRIWLVPRKIDSATPLTRQTVTSPPNDVLPEFTLVFPEQDDGRTKSLMITFDEPVRFTVRGVNDMKGIIVSVRLKKWRPSRGGKPPHKGTVIPPETNVEKTADDLMARGRAAFLEGKNEEATQILNMLLTLPPNQHSQGAQELVGVARERSKEFRQAIAEYELYLKLYPDSEGAERVRQRLAALKRMRPKKLPRQSLQKRPARTEMETSLFGSLSQYYYWGQTQSVTEVNNGGILTRTSDNVLDQSLVVSTLNLTGRARSDRYDNRVVLRGTNNLDTLTVADEEIDIRLRRAYVKHEDRERLYMVQIGRQFGSFGGILNPYDGGWVRYGVLPQLRLNLVGGFPQENSSDSDLSLDFGHYFIGGDVSFGPVLGRWSGDVYFLSQMVDGIIDRQAVGGELRYSLSGISAFSLLDYDVSYGELNIAMLNGSWQMNSGMTLNLLADYRKTPSLQTTNGLLASGTDSVKQALRSVTEDALRQQAEALTADSLLLQLALTYPLTTQWQLGGDISLSRLSGTDAAGIQPAVPGTGNVWTYTTRVLGREFLIKNHSLSLHASYIDSPSFDAQSLLLNSLSRFGDGWQLDASVTLYHQLDKNNVQLFRVTPSMRLGYRWRNNTTFEVEAGIERADTNGQNQEDSSLRQFIFVGYVWEH